MNDKIMWNPKIPILLCLLDVLYTHCCTGGCCHIVTDDYNINDGDIKFVREYCMSDGGKMETDSELSFAITTIMSLLTVEQRALVLHFYEHKFYCGDEHDFNRIISTINKSYGSVDDVIKKYIP